MKIYSICIKTGPKLPKQKQIIVQASDPAQNGHPNRPRPIWSGGERNQKRFETIEIPFILSYTSSDIFSLQFFSLSHLPLVDEFLSLISEEFTANGKLMSIVLFCVLGILEFD